MSIKSAIFYATMTLPPLRMDEKYVCALGGRGWRMVRTEDPKKIMCIASSRTGGGGAWMARNKAKKLESCRKDIAGIHESQFFFARIR